MTKFDEVSDQTISTIILAKEAKPETIYLIHGNFQKVMIHGVSGAGNVIATFPDQDANYGNRIMISGSTTLIPFDEEIYNMFNKKKGSLSKSAKSDKSDKPKKEQGPKMSDIINPMIIAGEDPEKIADAVIEKFPERAATRLLFVELNLCV